MGDMENNPYKIAQVCKIYIWLFEKSAFQQKVLTWLSLSSGDQKVQDDRWEQLVFPQCWAKVSFRK